MVQPVVVPLVQVVAHTAPLQPRLSAHVPFDDWQAPVPDAHPVNVVVCAGATESLQEDGAQAIEQQLVAQMPLRHCPASVQATPTSRTQEFAPLFVPSHEYPGVSHPVSCDMLATASHVPGVEPLQVRQVPHVVAV